MNDSISLEFRFFLISILSGTILLVTYDFIRIFRRVIKHSKFFIAIEDILFWIASSIFIFAMMYQQNNGVIRGFSIMAMVIGMLIYNQLISRVFIKIATTIINNLIMLIKKVIKLLLFPFKIVFGFLFKHIKKFFRFLKKKLKKFCKYVAKRLKKILKTVKISVTKD